jgi:class 3 adenylate cyclase
MSSTVFFTGHMIDRPGRPSPRFPTSLVTLVAAALSAAIREAGATDGFASAACGGDILFHETILENGGRAHITLPCAVDAFRSDCVDLVPGADWAVRFDRLLSVASSVEILGDEYASDNAMASECCNRVMVGLARRCARAKGERDPSVLALWDRRPGDAPGGTHSAIQFCLSHGLPVRSILDLSVPKDSRDLSPAVQGTSSAIRHAHAMHEAPQQICSIVFADAVGFRRLREREVPKFFRIYLGTAMEVLQRIGSVPLVKNSWGDGLYFVFEFPWEAGLFSIGFRDQIAQVDWKEIGLDFRPAVRIGVHAGPLYRLYDPITGQWNYTGSHTTRAARLEPSAEPGRVFATLPFAALSAAEDSTDYRCHPIGKRKLVKDAGEIMVFELLAAEEQQRRK